MHPTSDQEPARQPSHPDDAAHRLQAILASPSYRLAIEDPDYMRRDELRPSRLALEYLKPELILEEHGIVSTIVVFGGTRIAEPHEARARVHELESMLRDDPGNPELERRLAIARRVLAKSHYYEVARDFSALVSRQRQHDGQPDFVIITGGGPGIMEAANRGAHDVGAKSIGLNITIPHEQVPNSYITPDLCFLFRYFAIRKMHFMKRAQALVAFPGGYGTLDELFEALTLVQTRKVRPLPIILCGRDFWSGALNLEYLADEGTINPEDLDLFRYAETAEEIWKQIRSFHALPD
ncbi:MAG: TIGR00730 family Rossman fold protein [Candidatus Eiseniibacteriota bacterium]|jgi:uncharacterized protein (TIGR00730 family)